MKRPSPPSTSAAWIAAVVLILATCIPAGFLLAWFADVVLGFKP